MKFFRSKLWILLLVLALTASIGACGYRPEPEKTESGQTVFRLGFSETPSSLDPYTAETDAAAAAISLLYDTLFYADIETTPDYLSNTTGDVSTDNFYWSSRMIAAMADASYKKSVFHIERYQEHVLSKGHEIINRYDDMIQNEADTDKHLALKHEANQAVADMLKAATSDTLGKVLYELSNEMKNAYSRSDA